MIKKEEVVLTIVYDEIDRIILDALSGRYYTVTQLSSILRYRLGTDISSMQIVKKLEYLQVLGKVGKRRKNARLYEYFCI